MIYYIARDKITGYHLPVQVYGRGATRVRPTIKQPPRLWNKKAHAQQALNWWLKGMYERSAAYNGESEVICIPQTNRIPERWEVRAVEIFLR